MRSATGVPLVEIVAGDRPAWLHELSGVTFRLIPGGSYVMGLSQAEAAALAATGDPHAGLLLDEAATMRPTRTVAVRPFLLARHPLTIAQVRAWIPGYDDDYADDPDDVAQAARLEDALDDLLEVLPFRLPAEAEWEYAARAGTTTLTYRGDAVPSEEVLLDRFDSEAGIRASENPFGLAAMGSVGEACADVYRPGYAGAPSDARPRLGDGPRVVRGGAADLSPWQDCGEWLTLLSAARAELDMFSAVRPALDVAFVPSGC